MDEFENDQPCCEEFTRYGNCVHSGPELPGPATFVFTHHHDENGYFVKINATLAEVPDKPIETVLNPKMEAAYRLLCFEMAKFALMQAASQKARESFMFGEN